MNIKSRLEKLEKNFKPNEAPLVMIKFDDAWTSEQQYQIDQASSEKRDIIFVNFVGN